jgi:nucleoside-diphosphate kinase
MERVLVLIKPDGVERAIIGKVISVFEDTGLKVVGMKMLKATSDIIQKHYTDDENWLLSVGSKTKKSYAEKGIEVKESEREIGLRIRSQLISEISKNSIVAIVFEGNSAIEIGRKLAGVTEPRKADPSTIRGKYSSDSYELADKEKRPLRNIVHVSENAEIAKDEIKVWFKENELFDYKRADEDVMYKK